MWHSLIRVAKLYMIHVIFCVAVAVVSFSFSFTLVFFVLSFVMRNICFDCEMLMSEITLTASIKWVLTLCLLPESFYLKASVKQLLDLSLCKHYENTVVRSSFMQTLKQGSHSLESSDLLIILHFIHFTMYSRLLSRSGSYAF